MLTPLERLVRDKCLDGDITWLPDERCIALEEAEDDDDAVQVELAAMKAKMASIENMLADLVSRETVTDVSDV
jgi:hypothetical protein